MIGVLAMLLANAGATVLAFRLADLLGEPRPHLRLVSVLLARLLVISFSTLLFGAIGAFRPIYLAGVLGLLLVCFWRPGDWHFLKKPVAADAVTWIGGFLALRLLLETWYLSPFLSDVTSYHLPKVAGWVQSGSLFAPLGPDARAWFPSGFELVEAWWMVFLHHDLLVELAGLEFVALGAAAAYSMAIELGLDPKPARLAALVYATVPGIMMGSVSCLNDAAVASVVTATYALVVARVSWPVLALSSGLGAGMKATYLFAAAGALGLWILWARKKPPPRASRAACAIGLLALGVGSVWYARNAFVHGNPAYPMGTAALTFGAVEQGRHVGPSFGKLDSNLAQFAHRFFDRRRPQEAMLDGLLGWGMVSVSFGLVGLIAWLCREKRSRALFAAYTLSLVIVFSVVETDAWCMRFVLFFPALLALGAAYLSTYVPPLRATILGTALLTLVGTLVSGDNSIEVISLEVSTPWRTRAITDAVIPPVPFNRVACFAGPSAMAYAIYRPDLSREVIYLEATSAGELRRKMKDRGLTFLFASSAYSGGRWGVVMRELGRQPWCTQVATSWYRID